MLHLLTRRTGQEDWWALNPITSTSGFIEANQTLKPNTQISALT